MNRLRVGTVAAGRGAGLVALAALLACGGPRRAAQGGTAAKPRSAARPCAAMNDSVPVGYGAQRRCDMTGSVASVRAEDWGGQPSGSIAELLRTRAPGLDVFASNGTIRLRVRGVAQVNGSGDPLVVIDGMPIDGSGGAALAALSPSDVARVDVLKDAGAAAVYGSRAANGVVLVTTRRR